MTGRCQTFVGIETHRRSNGATGSLTKTFETSELFFRKSVEGRILFRYTANGKVDALIDRRNNEDVLWKKTR
jgi:hypothetical protein